MEKTRQLEIQSSDSGHFMVMIGKTGSSTMKNNGLLMWTSTYDILFNKLLKFRYDSFHIE